MNLVRGGIECGNVSIAVEECTFEDMDSKKSENQHKNTANKQYIHHCWN